MKTLLSGVKKSDVLLDPFPHIVITDPIEDELCLQLISAFPTIRTITGSEIFESNQRFNYPASKALSSESVSPLWKEFIKTNTSNVFLREFIDLFEEQIRLLYPAFEKNIGALSTLRAGTKGVDPSLAVDVLLVPNISLNAPVFGIPSLVNQAHVDLTRNLFVALYYLRNPQDTSTGGDLEIYKFKHDRPYYGFRERRVDNKHIELVKTIKYQRNVLVLFLNSIHAIHRVSSRSTTDLSRNFFFMEGRVNQPLFDLVRHERARFRFRKALKERSVKESGLAS